MYRVLVLTSTFPRWQSDIEPRFVLDLCSHLSRHADIRVIAPHAPGAELDEVIEGVRVHRFRYFLTHCQALTFEGGIVARIRENPWRVFQLPFLFLALYRAARRQIREWQPDVIHAHWIVPQGLVACLVSRARIPVICTSHGGDVFGLQSTPLRWLKSWTLRQCRSIVVVSNSMIEPVRKLASAAEAKVIPMGTDLSVKFTPPTNAETRSNRELLFVGRLVEKKGVAVLLEALALSCRRRSDLMLTIVGDGPLRGQLQRRVSELKIEHHVEFSGGVAHADLPKYYKRAMLAVFPFIVAKSGDQEGFGLVITEAMGCGCPVIASDLPAVHQSIRHDVTGMLTPAGDVDALADTICRYSSDSSGRNRISVAALKFARSNFDWPEVSRRYLEEIERVCDGGRSTAST